jgi:phosphate transport system substrate-binding protein
VSERKDGDLDQGPATGSPSKRLSDCAPGRGGLAPGRIRRPGAKPQHVAGSAKPPGKVGFRYNCRFVTGPPPDCHTHALAVDTKRTFAVEWPGKWDFSAAYHTRNLKPHKMFKKESLQLIASGLLATLGASQNVQAEKIVIKGSDTLGAKLVPQLAEAYKAVNPGTEFSIAAEGSTTGISAVTDSTADIGMSSRPAKPTEQSAAGAKGVTLTQTIVAYDGMAVAVNEKNPLKGLTKAQVEALFTGDARDWSAVGGVAGKVSVYTRNTSSGTYSDWKELAMQKRDYAGGSQKLAGNEQIVAEVAKNPNGIGYVGLAYIKSPGIKVVPVDGKLPTKESVQGRSYPYSRPTFYYTNGEPTGNAKAFVDFTLGAKGQAIVEQVGFITVK